ncbi:hypothetical protein [uncultured Helicobacter sp.]|uniref:hypothetical protein n=1 Tax=uncultured Helicobacter sp. TaxID=175537 RepID=UPI0037504F9F
MRGVRGVVYLRGVTPACAISKNPEYRTDEYDKKQNNAKCNQCVQRKSFATLLRGIITKRG